MTGQHSGQRKCQRKATTTVSKRGGWSYWYCDEHALAIAPTAPREWSFDGPINIERTRNEAMQTAKSGGSDKERPGA